MSETIVFFGSGPVAAKSLELLYNNFTIEAVITKPVPEHHHGRVPVQEVCKKLNIKIIEASDKKDLSVKVTSTTFASQIAVLIDFGIIVAQNVIDVFPLGIVNSHFSLLPEWRGPDPITFAILSGQRKTGVSLMLLVEKMDEGPIIAQGVYQITPEETAISLTTQLVDLSYAMLKSILPEYIAGNVEPQPQEVAASAVSGTIKASYSRKLTKEDGWINWHKPANQIEREIRAFIEWPKSHVKLAGYEVIVTKARTIPLNGAPGEIEVKNKQLLVFCSDQALEILQLKPTGGAEMTARAFLAGHNKDL
jgi:methionyl-tRNA formyltransferase